MESKVRWVEAEELTAEIVGMADEMRELAPQAFGAAVVVILNGRVHIRCRVPADASAMTAIAQGFASILQGFEKTMALAMTEPETDTLQ